MVRPRHHAVVRRRVAWLAATALMLTACSSPGGENTVEAGSAVSPQDWVSVLEEARGQEVSMWMWGGDTRGNAYVDDVLAPAAAELGVTLRRVPVADTQDALNRILSEQQAGREDGSVDLIWVNGENFRTGQQAGAWACGWADHLPNAAYLSADDPLLAEDFGTPVEGCESPWHKAQFVLAYDSAEVPAPPRSIDALLGWAQNHPGRFTYPAPPDFTGSAFLRQALYDLAADDVPSRYDAEAAQTLTAPLWERLVEVAPSLWRGGQTYPRNLAQLEELFANDQVSFTMTYGPSTLDDLVARGVFPDSTRVLPLDGGTLGNASFLAIPRNAAHAAGAMVVADLALSPQQQLAKADPSIWGQYTVLDLEQLPDDVAAQFARPTASTVVPPFQELSREALPELSAEWVTPLEDAWRAQVLSR